MSKKEVVLFDQNKKGIFDSAQQAINDLQTSDQQVQDTINQALTETDINYPISYTPGQLPNESEPGASPGDISAWFPGDGTFRKVRWSGGEWEHIGEYILTPSIGLTSAGLSKNIRANGKYFDNYRPPVLNVLERPYKKPVWVDDNDIYSVEANTIFKNDEKVGFPNASIPRNNIFFKAPNGNLIVMWPTWLLRVSTDDGATWTTVLEFESGREVLGVQSICLDEETGNIYLVDYRTDDTFANNTIYVSSNNGESFSVFKETSRTIFRHWHGCMYDPVSKTVYFLSGDGQNKAGIYRLNANKDDIIPVYLNEDDPSYTQPARSIGVCFFQDHIVWGSDTNEDPAIYRIKRADIGKPGISAERIADLPNTGWWTQRAADDDSKWIICTASQSLPGSIDKAAHLYLVENEGDNVYNIGSEFTNNTNARFGPVGSERKSGGDEFWISGIIPLQFWGKCAITRSTNDLLSKGHLGESDRRPVSISQRYDWPSGDNNDKAIFQFSCGSLPSNPIVIVHEAACGTFDSGAVSLTLQNVSQNSTLFSVINQKNYRRYNDHFGGYLYKSKPGDIVPGDLLEVVLHPNNTSSAYGMIVLTLP